ncbi:MAG: acyl-homoserine-lactone synthase [Mesorhizobium sp.]
MEMHVVTAANRHCYRHELIEFFQARHAIYVHEKRWREDDGSGFEVDQFDTEAATYLIGEEDGRVICGTRLLSTTVPHMVDQVFPQMCDITGIIRSPRVAEWTRAFVIPDRREHGIGPIKGQICAAVMQFCLQEGIEEVGGIQDLYWMRMWKRLAWRVNPAGTPAKVAGRWCVVAYMQVDEAARDSAMASTGATAPGLVQRGPYQPFVTETERRMAI